MITYPKIQFVKPLEHQCLQVQFNNGIHKIYDCSRLLQMKAFEPLKDDLFFNAVQVDAGGYGISWSDEVDLAESELWLNGETIVPSSEAGSDLS